MKDTINTALSIKTLAFGAVRSLIESASDNAATAIASAVEKYHIKDDTPVFRKS